MPAPIEALVHWHEYYTLLGTASATMVGLLFVAATVASGIFSADRRGALRMFLSASVVHFSGILAVSLVVLVPVWSWELLGAMITGCGIFGLGYYAMAWRDTVRDGLSARIDLEDRVWYAVLPVLGYLFEVGSGVMLALRMEIGGAALALSVGVLLVIGIRNAWDITVWSITRQRQ